MADETENPHRKMARRREPWAPHTCSPDSPTHRFTGCCVQVSTGGFCCCHGSGPSTLFTIANSSGLAPQRWRTCDRVTAATEPIVHCCTLSLLSLTGCCCTDARMSLGGFVLATIPLVVWVIMYQTHWKSWGADGDNLALIIPEGA